MSAPTSPASSPTKSFLFSCALGALVRQMGEVRDFSTNLRDKKTSKSLLGDAENFANKLYQAVDMVRQRRALLSPEQKTRLEKNLPGWNDTLTAILDNFIGSKWGPFMSGGSERFTSGEVLLDAARIQACLFADGGGQSMSKWGEKMHWLDELNGYAAVLKDTAPEAEKKASKPGPKQKEWDDFLPIERDIFKKRRELFGIGTMKNGGAKQVANALTVDLVIVKRDTVQKLFDDTRKTKPWAWDEAKTPEN